MARFGKPGIIQGFDALDTLAFFAFCMSVPLFLPVLDLWRGMTVSAADAWSFLPSVPFASALSLSAMFTALAFLFICLLKTAHARVSRTIMLLALAGYAAGSVLLDLWSLGVLDGSIVEAASGLMMGFGAAIMCLVWVSRLHVLEFKRALVVVWLAGCVLFASTMLLSLAGPAVARFVLSAAALLSVAGCARLFFRSEGEVERSIQAGVNWWDVFGHLDVSVVEGTGDFKTPLARALFFAVMPFSTLLLFVADYGLSREMEWDLAPLGLAGALAVAAMVPLVRVKSDQALINFSYRFFLPIVAFLVFAATAFVEPSLQHGVMAVGAFAFCAIYALVMSAMLVAMAGRMRSLALPAGGIMIIVGCLVCLLSGANVNAGALAPYQYQVLIVLFVVLAAVLMITPSSRLWRVMLEGIEAVESSALDAQEGYVRRCAELSRERHLTAREAEILVMLGRGHTSGYVAEELTVAESTVRSHRKNIYRKLDVSSREELFKLLDGAGGDEAPEEGV
ncbi:helix-turn-helix transcriptional regulator [Arabiibacter massiliensis]|uniref:helix-turn-helix transcriptional regulator n=1 Tax=Arabiibacter massiliensis TaxID=1870985 RepID=UPI001E4BB218|nr:helix-turn-helix transcriptional regulator [Arabiibacter massiliensis]